MHGSAVLVITALMVGGLVSCSDDEPTSSTGQGQTTVATEDEMTSTTAEVQTTSGSSLPATSTVTVAVTEVEAAAGFDLAGILYKGTGPGPDSMVVGGFGAAVDADPFSTTQYVRAPRSDWRDRDFDPDADWPYVTDEPASLEPGTYYLQLWLGPPPLCCYSVPWVPAGPSLMGCGTVFTVKDDEQVNITVSGIPPGGHGPAVTCPTGPLPSSATMPATTVPPDSDSIPLTNVRYLDPVFDAVDVSTATFADDRADLVDGHPISLRLDIYQPGGDTADRRPVIVWIHGGGFTGGSRSSEADIATTYARLGYVTASVDYRTDPDNRCGAVQDRAIADPAVLDTETARCERALQAAQDDVALALAWLRSHAPSYRIDPTRIAVGGFSAGAITAVHLAQRQNAAGPTPAESAVSVALAASGCNYYPDSIDASDAPISVLAAGGDSAVPYTCSVDTLDRAEAAGVMVQRLLYPYENAHAYGLYRNHQTEVDTAWRDFLIDSLDLD